MNSLFTFSTLFYSLIFILSSYFIYFVPGIILLKKLRIQLPAISQMVVSFTLGYVLIGIQGYVFGYLNVRFMTYAYVAICILFSYRYRGWIRDQLLSFLREIKKVDILSLLLLGVGIFVQIIQMIGTGVVTRDGMSFFRVHMQDGIYHLSLIQSIVRNFPPVEPGAAGLLVQNYHYWSDLIFAEQSRIFHIPVHNLFFQFFPFLFSLFTGLVVISLIRRWSVSKNVLRFALFFLFFGADTGYIAAFLIHRIFSFQYPVIDNGALQFLNMPHVAAKFVFLTSMLTLDYWLKEKEWKWGIVTTLFTAVLFGLKIYFALYAILGLACVGVVVLVKSLTKRGEKKFYYVILLRQMTILGLVSAVGALAIYLPPNHGAGGLIYLPLEWPKLILSQDNLDWTTWRYKLAVAQLLHMRTKIILYDIQAILVTFLVIHGTRIFGFFTSRKTIKSMGLEMSMYCIVPTIVFTFLGLYTFQVSGGFNVFNFFAMSLTILSILTAFFVASTWDRGILGKFFVILILAITLPRIVFETQKIILSYRDHTDVTYISNGEMLAMSNIDNKLPLNCVVATSPANGLDMKTPYVSYFTNRFTYMSGQNVLETHNQPTLDRLREYKSLFSSNNVQEIVSELRKKKVCALYLKKDDESLSIFEKSNLPVLYENDAARVIDLRIN